MCEYIPVIGRKQCCKVWLDDILYIQQNGRITDIVTETETYSKYCKAQDYTEYLDKRFYSCLYSMILNFDQVSSMKEQTIIFKNGNTLMLGRQNFIHTKQAFAAYLRYDPKNQPRREKTDIKK